MAGSGQVIGYLAATPAAATRAGAVAAHLPLPVTLLGSVEPAGTVAEVVSLPALGGATDPVDATAGGVLHHAPLGDSALRAFAAGLSAWIATRQPRALVVDGPVEAVLLARSHGVPVLPMVLPGARGDLGHHLAFRMAARLLALWPRPLYDPPWLGAFADRAVHVGGLGRDDGETPLGPPGPGRAAVPWPRALPEPPWSRGGAGSADPVGPPPRPGVLVRTGAGPATLRACAEWSPEFRWLRGAPGGDPRADLRAADVVIAPADPLTVADLAVTGRRAVLIPDDDPFDEQRETARALASAGIALAFDHFPAARTWPGVLAAARALDPERWKEWETEGAARRAAAAIGEVAGITRNG